MSLATAPPNRSPEQDSTPSGLVRGLKAAAAVVVVVSIAVFVWSAVATSTARVTATTSGSSFFAAGTIDLVRPDTAVELLFDADGLYPGRTTSGCVEIEYRGSIPASVRLHADRVGGTGLDSFIDLRISDITVSGCAAGTGEHQSDRRVFDGRLDRLWRVHPTYRDALVLREEMMPGDRIALFATAGVVDDNAAQGLTTEFTITVEARP